MNKYFNKKDTLYDITDQYPETIDVFVANGFKQLENKSMREVIGKTISLEIACLSKEINIDIFEEKLIETIKHTRESEDKTLIGNKAKEKGDIRLEGVLPCPVRIPLLESFNKWIEEEKDSLPYKISYDLKSANIGVDWIRDKIASEDQDSLADIYMSAGFDLFFDKDLIGGYRSQDIFKDISGWNRLNQEFDNKDISLKDPNNQYTVVGSVPAVFVVNTNELKGRKVPRTWQDLLGPEFENSISLPLHDFDLFNALLLTIYKNYGEAGIKKLGRSLLNSMAPAEMVKSYRKKEASKIPVVTVMPYLFTQMIQEDSPLKPIWPEDGAIISPIILLSKSSSKDKTKPLVDFFLSKEVGELMSKNGRFPSTHPQIVNDFTKGRKFLWLGWDFINRHKDIGGLINKCMDLFYKGKEG